MRHAAGILALALLVPLAACDGGGPADVVPDVVGTYELRTMNAQPLPFVLVDNDEVRIEITSGSMTFRPDRSFVDSAWFLVVEDDDEDTVEDMIEGTYSQSGTTVTLQIPGAGSYSATLSGDTLRQVLQGLTFVYVR